jgi:hypothetical protein
VALLALPTHYASRLSPYAPKLFNLLLFLDVVLAVGSSVSRITRGPLIALGRLSWAPGASSVVARLAGGCCGRNKKSVALVADAPDSLCCWLVCKLVAVSGGECESLLLPGLLSCLFLLLLTSRLLLGVSWALFAALVLTLHADPVVTVECTAFVAASVHSHANGLLYAWYRRSRSTCHEQVARLESQSVPGEESAGTLQLHGIAMDDWGVIDERGCRYLDAGCRSEVGGGINGTAIHTVSNETWTRFLIDSRSGRLLCGVLLPDRVGLGGILRNFLSRSRSRSRSFLRRKMIFRLLTLSPGRSRPRSTRRLWYALARLLPLEYTAHTLHVFAQTLPTLPIVRSSGWRRRHGCRKFPEQ